MIKVVTKDKNIALRGQRIDMKILAYFSCLNDGHVKIESTVELCNDARGSFMVFLGSQQTSAYTNGR